MRSVTGGEGVGIARIETNASRKHAFRCLFSKTKTKTKTKTNPSVI
jgi:hypothetical protein